MPNQWIKHVKAYHAKHPKLSYKEALTRARPSYKSQKGRGGGTSRHQQQVIQNELGIDLSSIDMNANNQPPEDTRYNSTLLNVAFNRDSTMRHLPIAAKRVIQDLLHGINENSRRK